MRLWPRKEKIPVLTPPNPARFEPIGALPARKRSTFGPPAAKKHAHRQAVPMRKRSYDVGELDDCIGWDARDSTADGAIYTNMDRIRARCRDLARNNDYARAFIRRVKSNVVGPHGLKFQARAKLSGGKNFGKLDKVFNTDLEALYRAAGKKKNRPTVDGRLSLREVQALWMSCLVIDGEVLIRHHDGTTKNKFRYGIEFIDPARLDWMKNETLPNGNQVKMGVECDGDNMPVAYWILERHPQEHIFTNRSLYKHQRVPAEFITHSFVSELPGQTRGVSMLASAALRAHLINQFEKAIVIGGIVAAGKVGFYKVNQEKADDYGILGNYIEEDDEQTEDVNDDATLVQRAGFGMFEQLPSYVDGLESFDTDYPPANFEEFEKRMLRGMASGFGDQYHGMANDLEGVNYTSSRTGELSQRDVWRELQNFLSAELMEPHFERWASLQTFNNALSIDKGKLAKLVENETFLFVPRGWSWVDPLKELKAHETALALGLTTRRKLIAESDGREFEDVIDELAEEESYMRDKGIEPRAPDPKAVATVQDEEEEEG
ncbi:phage portal protein [Roseibacillus ishigakijimensis]|uniref:Phage portal protein n=1 Tax=Roseibacillus ishigakijimensis TaxID=454146 RepID=A0A934RSB3_9BACT|nr:phage portal protein [Roseibacillus ishigakijimensis]MBK1835017.1 phage portal protein [Roseibacillus ishigakijimensis]